MPVAPCCTQIDRPFDPISTRMPDTNRPPLSQRSPIKSSPLKASPLKATTAAGDAPQSQRGSPVKASPRQAPVSHRTKTKKTKQKVQKSLHEVSAARPSSPTGGSPNGSPKAGGSSSKQGDSELAEVKEEPDMSDEAATLLREALSFRQAPATSPGGSQQSDEADSRLEAMAEEAWESGWVDEAESLYRKLLGSRRARLGDRHEDTIVRAHAAAITITTTDSTITAPLPAGRALLSAA